MDFFRERPTREGRSLVLELNSVEILDLQPTKSIPIFVEREWLKKPFFLQICC